MKVLGMSVLVLMVIVVTVGVSYDANGQETAEAYWTKGVDYHNKGMYEEAIAEYTKAIEINPKLAAVHHNRGIAYHEKRQYDQAISDFTKAIEINPKLAAVHHNRGRAYHEKRQYDQAISDFTEAIEINPKVAEVYNSRGISYGKKRQYDQAISDFTKAIEINPRYSEAYYFRAGVGYYNGEYDKAWEDVRKVQELGIHPVHPKILDTLRKAFEAKTPLTEELLLVRAQPAVFMIQAFGDIEVDYPKGLSTKKRSSKKPQSLVLQLLLPRSLLQGEYDRDLKDSVIEETKNRSDYFWEKVAENPAKYLEVSTAREVKSLHNVHYRSGTGFAVSREGVLLTNAHVVSDPDTVSIELIGQLLKESAQPLINEFGGEPSEAIIGKLVDGLIPWFANQINVKGAFKHAQVVLKFGAPEPFQIWDRRPRRWGPLDGPWTQRQAAPPNPLPGLASEYNKTIQPLTVFAEVLVKGEPLPGKDVAVLKVEPEVVFGAVPRVPSINAIVRTLPKFDAKDRLICLSLGDSDAVWRGTQVQLLGFPGAAFNPMGMESEAQFLVSSKDGKIGQIKPMRDGWAAFETTTPSELGDSGGPVLDKQGNVIGLNAGFATPESKQALAIPINVAKEFLKQAGINPDPGPLTQLWVEALKSFASERYTEAYVKFQDILEQQAIMNPVPLVSSNDDGLSLASNKGKHPEKYKNPYVVDMSYRSFRKKDE